MDDQDSSFSSASFDLEPLEPEKEEKSGKGSKRKKVASFLVLGLILLTLPAGLLLVRQSQENRPSAECSPDPDKCWTINSQSSQEACEAWCSQKDEYEDSCSSYKVLNDVCKEEECWSCKRKEVPTPVPGECQSGDVSKRTKEGCENWCGCSPGGDIHNAFEDTCRQDTYADSPSYMCWYCTKRPEPLNDCCSCWSDCAVLPCPDGLTCQDVGGTKRCVNPNCPTDQDCVCDQELTPTPTNTPAPTNTPPLSSISCEYCRLYSEDWAVIDVASAVFSLDQKLYLATQGLTTENQGITKARFRVTVNSQAGSWQESVQKKGDEFYLPYTISQAGIYEVEAMIYNPALGWH